jgi:spore coat protein U-like protein
VIRSALYRTFLVIFGVGLSAVGHTAVTCSVTSSAVAFGTYDPSLGTPYDSTGTVAVTCSLTKPDTVLVGFTIAITQGASGAYSNRTLIAGASNLVYNIYTDPGHTSVWGDGSGGSNLLNGSVGLGHGLGNNGTDTVNYTSYGRITAGQDVLPGTYMDLLTVTVTY